MSSRRPSISFTVVDNDPLGLLHTPPQSPALKSNAPPRSPISKLTLPALDESPAPDPVATGPFSTLSFHENGSVLHGSVEDLLAYWLDPVMGVEDHNFLQTAWMTFPKYICTHEELFNLLLTALFASPETEAQSILLKDSRRTSVACNTIQEKRAFEPTFVRRKQCIIALLRHWLVHFPQDWLTPASTPATSSVSIASQSLTLLSPSKNLESLAHSTPKAEKETLPALHINTNPTPWSSIFGDDSPSPEASPNAPRFDNLEITHRISSVSSADEDNGQAWKDRYSTRLRSNSVVSDTIGLVSAASRAHTSNNSPQPTTSTSSIPMSSSIDFSRAVVETVSQTATATAPPRSLLTSQLKNSQSAPSAHFSLPPPPPPPSSTSSASRSIRSNRGSTSGSSRLAASLQNVSSLAAALGDVAEESDESSVETSSPPSHPSSLPIEVSFDPTCSQCAAEQGISASAAAPSHHQRTPTMMLSASVDAALSAVSSTSRPLAPFARIIPAILPPALPNKRRGGLGRQRTSSTTSNESTEQPEKGPETSLLELLVRTCAQEWPRPSWQCSVEATTTLAAEHVSLRKCVQAVMNAAAAASKDGQTLVASFLIAGGFLDSVVQDVLVPSSTATATSTSRAPAAPPTSSGAATVSTSLSNNSEQTCYLSAANCSSLPSSSMKTSSTVRSLIDSQSGFVDSIPPPPPPPPVEPAPSANKSTTNHVKCRHVGAVPTEQPNIARKTSSSQKFRLPPPPRGRNVSITGGDAPASAVASSLPVHSQTVRISKPFSIMSPVTRTSSAFLKKFTQFQSNAEFLLSVSLEVLADQLLLLEYQLLRSLNVRELLKCAWMKDGWSMAPSVLRHTLHFNRLAAWVGTEIMLAPVSLRTRMLSMFLRLASVCVQRCNNFAAAFAISSGLNSNAVYRLKSIWDDLSGTDTSKWEELQAFTSTSGNFAPYRTAFGAAATERRIPQLSVILKDLCAADEPPSKLSDGRVNLPKLAKISDIIEQNITAPLKVLDALSARGALLVATESHTPSAEAVVERVEMVLAEAMINSKSDDEMYALSLRVEPRQTAETRAENLMTVMTELGMI